MRTLLLGLVLAGQTPTFDVVSVKPNPNNPGMSIQTNRGRFLARGATLAFLIQFAYRLKPFQISGGPNWANIEKFEIEGRFDPEENKENDDKLLLMLQAALSDRFQLKLHREEREQPIFALTVAKDGPKLKTAADPAKSGMRGGGGSATATNTRTLTVTGGSMANLAAQLSQSLGRNVIDRTGLDGKFDFRLEWTNDNQAATGNAAEPNPSAPSLFTALQEQLGLKLESGRGPVEIFIIDSAERPAEN